jgi:hypothetical protein
MFTFSEIHAPICRANVELITWDGIVTQKHQVNCQICQECLYVLDSIKSAKKFFNEYKATKKPLNVLSNNSRAFNSP